MANKQQYDFLYNKIYEIEETLSRDIRSGKLNFPNLAGGKGGAVLFYLYLYKFSKNSKYLDYTCNLFEECLANCSNSEMHYSYCGGFAGIYWLLNHLIESDVIDIDAYDAVVDVEIYLYNKMMRDLSEGLYDFLHNGLGVYFALLNSANLKNIDKQALIQGVTEKIEQCSIKVEGVIKWPDVDIKLKKITPGKFNLGLSHGIPSIISILAKSLKYCTKEDVQSKIKELCEGGAQYIFSLKSTNAKDLALFPYGYVEGEKISYYSRLAWCYGDPGIALSFWHLYAATKEEKWKDVSLEIMHHATSRLDTHANNVIDAGFCHGTAGIAHIFKKFYWLTGDKEFNKASWYWINKTCEYSKWKDGLAGFKSYNATHGYIHNYGLLEGIIGIGLVMISALSEVEYDWDKVWLVS